MTDTVTEFYNNQTLTYANLTAGVTVVAPSSAQQAVIKDLQIVNPNGMSLSFNIGSKTGAPIASVSATAKLTGSELIGASSSLVASFSGTPSINTVYGTDGGSNLNVDTFTTIFGMPSTAPSFSYSQNSIPTFSGAPYFMCFDSSGNFYWANPSYGLYKRSGGASGSDSLILSGAWGWSYDGSRYIYGLQSGLTLKVYDTQTATLNTYTLTGSSIPGNANTSYTSMFALPGGYIVFRCAYNYSTYWINANTLKCQPVGNNSSASGQNYWVGIGQQTNGNFVVLTSDYTTPYWYYWVGTSAQFDAGSGFTSGTYSTLPVGSYTGSCWQRLFNLSGNNRYIWYIGPNNWGYFDCNLLAWYSIGAPTGSSGYSSYAIYPALNSTQVSTDFGTIGIRATGILTS